MSTFGLSQERSRMLFGEIVRGERQILKLYKSAKNYDAGFTKDEYDCNSNKCECAYFDQLVIGNFDFY